MSRRDDPFSESSGLTPAYVRVTYKLMFGQHWLNVDLKGVDTGSAPYYGLKALDHNNGVIFVAPDGLNKGRGNQGGEDIAFNDKNIEDLQADLCINEKLISSMGFSYGAAMSYSLACSRPKVFRAVALMSGRLHRRHRSCGVLCPARCTRFSIKYQRRPSAAR